MKEGLPIEVDAEIMSGAPVFRGTRVPVEMFLNSIKKGATLDEFLDCCPTVTRDQAEAVLGYAKESILAAASG